MKKFLKIIFCLIVASISLVFQVNSTVMAEETNVLGNKIVASDILDYNLREYLNALSTRLGYSGLYVNIFSEETELLLNNREIATLEGLELFNFESLTKVDFSNNKITKIPQKAFYSMEDLQTLNLDNNALTSVDLILYARNVSITNNLLTAVTMQNKNLNLLDISNNKITNSNKITITSAETENYDILAYNNIMAGKNTLTNAYLGIQNLTTYASKDKDCDYELFSNSSVYKFYVYPFRKVCVGKDSITNELIYSDIKCKLSILNRETNEYDFVKTFNEDGTLQNITYEDVKPLSGYYKLSFVTENNEPIYLLDENYEFVTEEDYNHQVYKVINDDYKDIIVKAKPSETNNVFIEYQGNLYRVELAAKGPVDITLVSSIQNVTFEYLLNGQGENVIDDEVIPFKGNKIHIDQTSYYTLTVWIIENGVRSNHINFALNINIPRKMTVENWIFLITGIIAILAISLYFGFRYFSKDMKKNINDFEW